jgi:hypothetical protein
MLQIREVVYFTEGRIMDGETGSITTDTLD